jgi:uncharacterized protein
MIKQLVEHIVKYIVVSPESVHVEVFHDGPSCSIEIKVAPDDLKRVIGKAGATVKSIRSLVQAVQDQSQDITVNVKHE